MLRIIRSYWTVFNGRFVSSIDAVLAEKENQHLSDIGRVAIVAALHQVERGSQTGDWYEILFNNIRGLASADRTHALTVVTFNYDRSLEYFIYHAFKNAYHLSDEDALNMFNR